MCERRRIAGVDEGDFGAGIGEQPAADAGGQPMAELNDTEPRQQTHRQSFLVWRDRSRTITDAGLKLLRFIGYLPAL